MITKPREESQRSIDISFLSHSRWAGQLWKVKVSNVKCPQSLWCPKIQDTHWQSIFTFSTAHIWHWTLHGPGTVMDWRTLTPSDILTDCIYPDNYSLCIICTNNHLIISHLRVKSVLFRLHPPVISSFIQTPVTFDTSDPGLIVKFMRRKALDTRDDDPESSCRNQYLPPGSWHQRVLAQCSRQASQSCARVTAAPAPSPQSEQDSSGVKTWRGALSSPGFT